MILRHRDKTLIRFEWISSEEVRVDFVDEGLRHLLPLAFGSAVQDDRGALERALLTWLNRRTAPIFDNGYGLFSLLMLPENCAADNFAPIQAYLRDKHPALFDRWLDFPCLSALKLGECVERLKGFRFHRHHHYNLPTDRISLLERFLQKRVSDILSYLEKADEYIDVSNRSVGVNSKTKESRVGVKAAKESQLRLLNGDVLALQLLWNLKANPFMTQSELAGVLGRDPRTVARKMRVLRDQGIIRRIGSDKSGSWEVLVDS